LRDRRLLFALSGGLPALEALLVVLIGPPAAAALAPQVAAPAPFGVFHDLRWLLVYHSSWVSFAALLLALLSARVLLDAVLVRAAWPADGEPRPWREHVRSSLVFTAVQAALLVPFAALTVSMAVTSLSWLFFVAVPVLVMLGVLVHHGAVDRAWWRDPPSGTSVRALLLTFAALTVGGGVIALAPSWLRPVVAGGLGATVVAWCRVRMVRELVGREPPVPRRRPFAIVGIASVVALIVIGTAAGFALAIAVESGRTELPRVNADAAGPPVLVVKGFNSRWDGVTRRWVDGSFRIERFSYRGIDGDGDPRPYARADTYRSVRALARDMRRQVAALHRETGDPVSIVAESEGALIAQAYVAGAPDAPVQALVLLSPLVEPGRVHYPRPGQNGWGVTAGAVLDGISTALAWVGPVDVSTDTPLFRSIVDDEPELRRLLACPPRSVRSFAVLPFDSGVAAPAPLEIGYRHAYVPAFHGGLLGDGGTQEMIRAVLRGRPGDGSGFWAFTADVVNAGAAAWQAPSLVTSLEPGWRADLDDRGCAAVHGALQRWLD
jgi:hypothetical protein